LKARAKNKPGTKMEGHKGGMEAVPPVGSRAKASGQRFRKAKPLKLTIFY